MTVKMSEASIVAYLLEILPEWGLQCLKLVDHFAYPSSIDSPKGKLKASLMSCEFLVGRECLFLLLFPKPWLASSQGLDKWEWCDDHWTSYWVLLNCSIEMPVCELSDDKNYKTVLVCMAIVWWNFG